VKVIQPEELKISLKTILRKALKQYWINPDFMIAVPSE
jgi:hypothetical protein